MCDTCVERISLLMVQISCAFLNFYMLRCSCFNDVFFLLASSHSGLAPTWTGSTQSSEGKPFISLSSVLSVFMILKQDSSKLTPVCCLGLISFISFLKILPSYCIWVGYFCFIFALSLHPDCNSTEIIVPSVTSSGKKFSSFSVFHLFYPKNVQTAVRLFTLVMVNTLEIPLSVKLFALSRLPSMQI